MGWGQVWTVIAATAGLLTLQSFWIGRSLDAVRERLERLDTRFDRVEDVVLRDHGERIARLEERQVSS